MLIKKTNIYVEVITIWTILSIIMTLILLIPFFLNKQKILQITPICLSKKQFNVECFMCGMTRAFIEISQGNLKGAQIFNKYSLFLYLSFLLNSIVFFVFFISTFLPLKKAVNLSKTKFLL